MNALPPRQHDRLASMIAAPEQVTALAFEAMEGEQIGARGKDHAVSVVLADGRVATLVVQSAEDAREMAAARIDRGALDLLVADCRPVAHAVADALIAAGLGG